MTDRELRADLDELKKLEALAIRVNVKNVIHQEIVRLEASLKAVDMNDLRSRTKRRPSKRMLKLN